MKYLFFWIVVVVAVVLVTATATATIISSANIIIVVFGIVVVVVIVVLLSFGFFSPCFATIQYLMLACKWVIFIANCCNFYRFFALSLPLFFFFVLRGCGFYGALPFIWNICQIKVKLIVFSLQLKRGRESKRYFNGGNCENEWLTEGGNDHRIFLKLNYRIFFKLNLFLQQK